MYKLQRIRTYAPIGFKWNSVGTKVSVLLWTHRVLVAYIRTLNLIYSSGRIIQSLSNFLTFWVDFSQMQVVFFVTRRS
jgi:sulfite exporter TauE/SafE